MKIIVYTMIHDIQPKKKKKIMIHDGSPTCRLLVQEERTRYMNDESGYTFALEISLYIATLACPFYAFSVWELGPTEFLLLSFTANFA